MSNHTRTLRNKIPTRDEDKVCDVGSGEDVVIGKGTGDEQVTAGQPPQQRQRTRPGGYPADSSHDCLHESDSSAGRPLLPLTCGNGPPGGRVSAGVSRTPGETPGGAPAGTPGGTRRAGRPPGGRRRSSP